VQIPPLRQVNELLVGRTVYVGNAPTVHTDLTVPQILVSLESPVIKYYYSDFSQHVVVLNYVF